MFIKLLKLRRICTEDAMSSYSRYPNTFLASIHQISQKVNVIIPFPSFRSRSKKVSKFQFMYLFLLIIIYALSNELRLGLKSYKE